MQTALGLDFVKSVEGIMNEDHRIMHYRILDMVLTKLKNVILILEGLIKKPIKMDISEEDEDAGLTVRKAKYVLVKSTLGEAIEELEQWQRKVESSLFLIMRMMDHQVDTELVRMRGETSIVASIPSAMVIRNGLRDGQGMQVFLKKSELGAMTLTIMPFCDALLGQRVGSSKQLILNKIECVPGENVEIIKKDVRDLARKLRHRTPQTFSLLTCKGVVRDERKIGPLLEATYTLVFEKPEGLTDPRSLRHLLNAGCAPRSMSDKLDIARELAKSVSYVHTFGFVHKDIRPETVLTLTEARTARRSTFLISFGNFRREDGRTYLRNDGDWTKDLYRHPNRQGPAPRTDYIMQHDIFSLGVCMLEIGLWRSFVRYDSDGGHPTPLEALGLIFDGVHIKYPARVKDKFIEMAYNQLPACMGSRYAQIVHTCLTCLDSNNVDFGHEAEFQDEDGIRVGVRYIEKESYSTRFIEDTMLTIIRFCSA
jgi:serine/threonine protein kinase